MSCCFVPPYVLERLSYSEDPHLNTCSALTLKSDDTFRTRRRSLTAATVSPWMATVVASEALQGKRLVHDAENREILPGTPVRDDDDAPTGDVSVDEAHASSGQAYDLFAEVFGRASFDGSGSTTLVSVHYGQNYDNAFWDGTQLVFGDGDAQVFERFTKPMDILAHEFTHGVIQFSAGLVYQGQSGALNESVADVFAAMAKQRMLDQSVDQADWLIGAGLFTPAINGRALRSMIEPGTAYDDPQLGKDPQPGSMAAYVKTEEDNGGVHVNSGIPNRAFALAALAIGGRSWEQTGRIWYDTLTGGRISADVDFDGFAVATVDSASALFGDDPTVADKVRRAWTEVGLLQVSAPADEPPVEPEAPVDLAAPEGRVAVRRTGGFAGTVRSGELDLARDPAGPEVKRLLRQVNFAVLQLSAPGPDRFLYTLDYEAADIDNVHLTLPEQDLTPELTQVVQIVLGGVEVRSFER